MEWELRRITSIGFSQTCVLRLGSLGSMTFVDLSSVKIFSCFYARVNGNVTYKSTVVLSNSTKRYLEDTIILPPSILSGLFDWFKMPKLAIGFLESIGIHVTSSLSNENQPHTHAIRTFIVMFVEISSFVLLIIFWSHWKMQRWTMTMIFCVFATVFLQRCQCLRPHH